MALGVTRERVALAHYQSERNATPDAPDFEIRMRAHRNTERDDEESGRRALVARDAMFDREWGAIITEIDRNERAQQRRIVQEIIDDKLRSTDTFGGDAVARNLAASQAIKEAAAARPELFQSGPERDRRIRGVALARLRRTKPWLFLHLDDAAAVTAIGEPGRRTRTAPLAAREATWTVTPADSAEARDLLTEAKTDAQLREALTARSWRPDEIATALSLSGDGRQRFVEKLIAIGRHFGARA